MHDKPRILALAGSAREQSFNKRLARLAAAAAERAGAEVTFVDLANFPMPMFNQDLEARAGLPEQAHRFKALLLEHQGLIVASPEYNGYITPLLKNAIDWASRAETDDEPRYAAYRDTTAIILAASPGPGGGKRSLGHIRTQLTNIGVTVLPGEVSVARASAAFDESGSLVDAELAASVEALAKALVQAV